MMQRVHRKVNGISTTNRSRVSNGTKLAAGIDGRSPEARRFRDIIHDYEAEFETTSSFDRSLIRDAAFLKIKMEAMQSKHLSGENVHSDEIVRLSNQLRRMLVSLRRKAQAGAPAAPSLHDHLVGAGTDHDNDETEGEALTRDPHMEHRGTTPDLGGRGAAAGSDLDAQSPLPPHSRTEGSDSN